MKHYFSLKCYVAYSNSSLAIKFYFCFKPVLETLALSAYCRQLAQYEKFFVTLESKVPQCCVMWKLI